MTARLILSFDCEGKWGIADRSLDRQRALTSASLSLAYTTILETLRNYDAPATFAFVSAFCLPSDRVEAEVEKNYDRMVYGQKNWLEAALASVRSGEFEGWSEPDLISRVQNESRHHICSHGGFHIPYDELNTPPDAVDADIDLIRSVDPIAGNKQTLLVFPRNVIGFGRKLSEAGIIAYRDTDPRELRRGAMGRIERFFLEFAPLDRGDLKGHAYRTYDGMTALSPGKFLNASIGVRSGIPMSFTKRRIDRFFSYAVRNDAIVHFYSHPHNFIGDRTLKQKLDYLLACASRYQDKGTLRVVTMQNEFDEQR